MTTDSNLTIELSTLPASFAHPSVAGPQMLVFDREPADRRLRHILQTAAEVTPARWTTNGRKGETAAAARRYGVPMIAYTIAASVADPQSVVSHIIQLLEQHCRARAAAKRIRGLATIYVAPGASSHEYFLGAVIVESK